MIEITSHRQGAILNHNHGKESADRLTVKIQGICETGLPVKVNEVEADMDGRIFTAEIDLTQKFNPIIASVRTPYGNYSQQLDLVWDKKSFKRYYFYMDDHSFLFTDLAKERPKHAFDHFYLAHYKKLYEKYGIKVTLNCFYHNDHHDFELKDMPDTWKGEFEDNCHWLKFSFHSYGEFPDRPYLEATAEEFGRDYDLVKGEILRFAGEKSFIPPQVIHWGNIHPAVGEELIRRGTKAYSMMMRPRIMGGPSLADRQNGGNMRQTEANYLSGADRQGGTEGLRLHYERREEVDYLAKHMAYYDSTLGIFFLNNIGYSTNRTPMNKIPERVLERVRFAEKYGTEIAGMGGHEQYSFPYYLNYLPDHHERMELFCRTYFENGYTGAFFNEGILGNTAWDN